jgi:hypothetical protein
VSLNFGDESEKSDGVNGVERVAHPLLTHDEKSWTDCQTLLGEPNALPSGQRLAQPFALPEYCGHLDQILVPYLLLQLPLESALAECGEKLHNLFAAIQVNPEKAALDSEPDWHSLEERPQIEEVTERIMRRSDQTLALIKCVKST